MRTALARQPSQEEAASDSCALPSALAAELSRLHLAGHSLVPLGGVDGKTPLAKFGGRKRLPLEVVLRMMSAAGSETYGVRLCGMLVIDVDSATPEAAEFVARHYLPSPVMVRTRRGAHAYYRLDGPAPRAVRLPNVAIDFKTGANSYVVGPGSVRPGGSRYEALGEPLGRMSELPRFRRLLDRPEPASQPAPASPAAPGVPIGERHNSLVRRARDLALGGATAEAMIEALRKYRDREVENPQDVLDAEIVPIVNWCMTKRDNGQLWTGRNCRVPIPASAIDELVANNEVIALALLNFLWRAHGCRAEPFCVSPDAMRASGKFRIGRRQTYRAIETLSALGWLVQLPRSGSRAPHRYRLGEGRGDAEKKRRGLGYIGALWGHTTACADADEALIPGAQRGNKAGWV